MRSSLFIEFRDDGGVSVKPHHVTMEQLVFCAGALQNYVGMVAVENGVNLDEVRDRMLDVHLAAMSMLQDAAERYKRSHIGEQDKKEGSV